MGRASLVSVGPHQALNAKLCQNKGVRVAPGLLLRPLARSACFTNVEASVVCQSDRERTVGIEPDLERTQGATVVNQPARRNSLMNRIEPLGAVLLLAHGRCRSGLGRQILGDDGAIDLFYRFVRQPIPNLVAPQ